MILLPAIDILGGQAVRLTQGEFDQSTVYDADPLDAATSQDALVGHVEQAVLEARAAEVGDEDLHFRNISSTTVSGRGMTWALTSSPLADAA